MEPERVDEITNCFVLHCETLREKFGEFAMSAQDNRRLIDLIALTNGVVHEPNGTLKRTLEAVRQHLGMNVAYVSEFSKGRTVFREVDAPGLESLVKVGDSQSLDDVYCRHILEGRLPELIPDTALEPLAMAMPITAAAHIRSHISVPIRLPDGRIYGMFCCVGCEANPSLNSRDLQTMRAFADLAAFEIDRGLKSVEAQDEKHARIASAIDDSGFAIVYQPIQDMRSRQVVGFECLARFSGTPARPPNEWFDEAAEVGLATKLELAAIRTGLAALASLPAPMHLAINLSVETILSGELPSVLNELPLDRIVIEITEHTEVDDYEGLLNVLQPLRERGLRLAVDDTGAGYSSLRHILNLQPDFIKLDMGLIRHIDIDPARRALAAALIAFARDTDSCIIAEGVETASEFATLEILGVEQAQGYFLGRPMPLDSALRSIRPADRAVFVA
jgi:EAL domain-containing protein (putative c-di-GMP-specific phosphodiesterase class I)